MVEGGKEVRDWGELVGRMVEYCSRKQGKKLEAVTVWLLQEPCTTSLGLVSHWVPDQLAGVIQTEEGDVLVHRRDFIPGGFVADIVGRKVKFRLDRAKMEAASV